MDGDEIGQRQRAQHLLAAAAVLLGVYDHGQRRRRALIAAAGHDHNRQIAAAHAGVRGRGRIGLQQLAVLIIQLSHIDAPTVVQPLFRNLHVAVDLLLQRRFDIRKVARIRKVHDLLDRQAAVVRKAVLRAVFLCAEDALAVLFDPDDMRMGVFQLDLRRLPVSLHVDDQVQRLGALNHVHLAVILLHQCLRLIQNAVREIQQHLEHAVGVPAERAEDRRSVHAAQLAAVRDIDALGIFDQVPAGIDVHMLRPAAERLARDSRRIGDGDRLCAAAGRDQLFLQDIQKSPVIRICFFHLFLLTSLRSALLLLLP